jgi:hypothetical protein
MISRLNTPQYVKKGGWERRLPKGFEVDTVLAFVL